MVQNEKSAWWKKGKIGDNSEKHDTTAFLSTMYPRFCLAILLLLTTTANALHFYLDANEKRCFIEELPTDTVVQGTLNILSDKSTQLTFIARTLPRTGMGRS